MGNSTTFQENGEVAYIPVVVNGKQARQTNADRIRSMTDEELAEWIVAIIAQETIYSARKVPTPDYAIEMRQRWLEWLRQECER